MSDFKKTRRLLIQAAALAPIVGLQTNKSEVGQIVQTGDDDDRLKALVSRRAELTAEYDRLERQWRAIWPTLPEWCRSGPKYVNAKGESYGERVGWPAARKNLIRINDDRWLVRPSPYDLRGLYEGERIDTSPDMAADHYRRRTKQLRVRLRCRRGCYASWGLPTSSDWRLLEVEIDRIDFQLAATT
jgi:hypothetical protein